MLPRAFGDRQQHEEAKRFLPRDFGLLTLWYDRDVRPAGSHDTPPGYASASRVKGRESPCASRGRFYSWQSCCPAKYCFVGCMTCNQDLLIQRPEFRDNWGGSQCGNRVQIRCCHGLATVGSCERSAHRTGRWTLYPRMSDLCAVAKCPACCIACPGGSESGSWGIRT